MKKRLLTAGLIGLLTVPSLAAAEDISFSQVVLQGLDKVTGRLSTMTVNVGDKTTFGALDVYVRVCYAHPPEEMPENAAFLEIVEKKEEGQLKLFSGWMFSSSPALSAMDHPVYDVWVSKCQSEQVEPPTPEPLVLDNPIEAKPVQPKLKIMWDEEKQSVTEIPEEADEKPVNPEETVDESMSKTIVITTEPAENENREETPLAEPTEFHLIPITETKTDDSENTDEAAAPAPVEENESEPVKEEPSPSAEPLED